MGEDVTVVICTYNGEKYIGKQLDSILMNTVIPNEMIICDDKSTDNTMNIVKEYKKKYPELIKVIVNEKNLGVTANFEKGVLLAKGDYIFLSDQDDIWDVNKVEILIAKAANSEKTVFFTNASIIDNYENKLENDLFEEMDFNAKDKVCFQEGRGIEVLLRKDIVTGCTMLIKKEIISSIVPFSKNYVHDAWISIIAESLGQLDFCDKKLISYRVHDEQQIGLKSKKTRIKTKSRFDKQIIKNNDLLEKINSLSLNNPEKTLLIKEKCSFYEDRNKNSLINNIKNLLSGKYFKYTSGIKSFVADIFIRFRY